MLDVILKHPSLIRFIKLLDKTNGRDKLLRFVQYLLKFLSFYYHKTFLNTVASNLTNCRKSIRVAKPLSHLVNASNLFDDKLTNPTLIRSLLILKELSYANYLTFDTMVWLKNMKVLPADKKMMKIERISSIAWFTGVSANIVVSLIKYYTCCKKLKELSKEQERDAEKDYKDLINPLILQQYSIRRRLCWDFLDLTIVSNKLNYINVDDGVVGLCGTITSFFGIEDLWSATK